jgi:hypothetical protein
MRKIRFGVPEQMTEEATLQNVQDWMDGKISWNDLPQHCKDAIDEAILELSDSEPEEEPVVTEEPFTAEIVKQAEPIEEMLHKADNEHRFTLGPWYIPNQYDAHGEWTDADELQKSLWEYVKSGDRGIRLQHNKDIVAGEWLEAMSFPVPVTIGMSKDATSKQVSYPAGTVFLGVQWKPWAWEMVKAGKIQGFSIGGAAARIDMGMTEELAKFNPNHDELGRFATGGQTAAMGARLVSQRIQGRMELARIRQTAREKAGTKKPSLVDRVKNFLSDEYLNPKSLAEIDREDRQRIMGERRDRLSGRKERKGNTEAIYLPSGRTAIIQGDKISTTPFVGATIGRGSGYKGKLSKSDEQLRASARVNARVAEALEKMAFGGDRSEAGRYAANMRWRNHNIRKLTKQGSIKKPTTIAGKAAGKLAPSLVGHADLDRLSKALGKLKITDKDGTVRGCKIDDFEANDGTKIVTVVYEFLSPERQALWNNEIKYFVNKGEIPVSKGGPIVYLKGGGSGSGKSTPDPSITVPNANPSDGQFGAVLSDPDAIKLRMNDFTVAAGNEDSRAKETSTVGRGARWEGAASFVHEESSMIAQLVVGASLKAGRDVVIDGVADNGIAKQYAKIDSYREGGAKKIIGVFYSADIPEAISRAMPRAQKVGRMVTEKSISDLHKGVSKNFPSYARDGKFDSLSLFDTNARPAVRIYSGDGKNGDAGILEPVLYQKFLDKVNYKG